MPPVIAIPGVGVPVAVTLNVPGDSTVNVVEDRLLIWGATGVPTGVTITVPEASLVPAAFVAVTEQVYCMSLVRLATVIGETVLLPDPLGVHEALKLVTGLPPLFAFGVKASAAWRLPGVAVPIVGMPGATAVMVTLCVTCSAAL